MTRHSPQQQLKEARAIAQAHHLKVIDFTARDKSGAPKTEYIVYRKLPDGRSTRLGKRSTPAGLRKYVCDLTKFH